MPSHRSAMPVLVLLALGLLSIGASPTQAQKPPELLADIAESGAFESSPYAFQSLGTRTVYLDSGADSRQTTLWVTDGWTTQALGVLCPPCAWQGRALGVANGVAYYAASEVFSELGETTYVWRTDGTAAGTFPVTGPLHAPQGGLPAILTAAADNRLYFTACTPELGCELWSSDGTGQGTRPMDLSPGSAGTVVRDMVAIGTTVWFLGRAVGAWTPKMALWRADNGTFVTPLRELSTLPRPRLLTRIGNRFVFLAANDGQAADAAADAAAGGMELWTSDGTSRGTVPLTRFAAANPFSATRFIKAIDGLAYFLADDGVTGVELWSTNGTPRGTRRVTDFAPEMPFPDSPHAPFLASRLEKVGRTLLFPADDGKGKGVRLWTSRGRPGNTSPITRCFPSACPGAGSAYFARLGDGVVFLGDDAATGLEPWFSDGTGTNTRLITDTLEGSVAFRAFTSTGDRVYFERYVDQGEPSEIWVTDGTAGGTRIITRGAFGETHYALRPVWQPLELGTVGLDPVYRTTRVIFLGFDDTRGIQLWTSNGTAAGTQPLTSKIRPRSSWPTRFQAAGDRVYFTACSQTGTELWTSAGSPATTVKLLDVQLSCSSDVLVGAAPVGSGAILVLGGDVWRSDGTPAGTARLTQYQPQGGGVYIGRPLAVGGRVLFSVATVEGEVSLWSTDGTPQGLEKYRLLPGFANYETVAGGLGFFLVNESQGGTVLSRVWRTDGTGAGTYPVTSFNGYPTTANQAPPGFAALDGRVYFLTYVDGQGPQLWRTDGTPGGTAGVLTTGFTDADSLESEAGLLWFRARRTGSSEPRPPLELWRSDGTGAGTYALPANLSNGVLTPYFTDRFAGLGSRVYFQAYHPATGFELWTSDGTPEGTVLTRDLYPGIADSHPLWLVSAGGRLWFAANDGVGGTELWQTDGTDFSSWNIAPGALWSDPMEVTATGDSLYFSADDTLFGREPWLVPLS